MQYMLLIHGEEAARAEAGKAEMDMMFAAYDAYSKALRAAGVYAEANPLQASATASVVRVRDGKTQVLNGPYSESREQLGGYYVINTENLDAALAWAARCPGAQHGSVEVRPVMAM